MVSTDLTVTWYGLSRPGLHNEPSHLRHATVRAALSGPVSGLDQDKFCRS